MSREEEKYKPKYNYVAPTEYPPESEEVKLLKQIKDSIEVAI